MNTSYSKSSSPVIGSSFRCRSPSSFQPGIISVIRAHIASLPRGRPLPGSIGSNPELCAGPLCVRLATMTVRFQFSPSSAGLASRPAGIRPQIDVAVGAIGPRQCRPEQRQAADLVAPADGTQCVVVTKHRMSHLSASERWSTCHQSPARSGGVPSIPAALDSPERSIMSSTPGPIKTNVG